MGAGISGISIANNLADRGLEIILIEQNPFPGGRSVQYGCKATDSCVHCGVCLVRDALGNLKKNGPVNAFYSSKPRALHRRDDTQFEIEVESFPNFIDWRACVECGKCKEVCPVGAVRQVPRWRYYIDENCDRCAKCIDICPVGAINMESEQQYTTIDVASVVISSGFKPFEPAMNRKWGYGNNPRVITGSDLESLFFQEKYLPAALDPDDIKKVAFIQCVGSRSTVEGERRCSRVCCAYALRMANRMREEFADINIDFYYMDIQYFGKSFDRFWSEVKEKINFIHSNPISIKIDERGRPVIRYEAMADLRCQENIYDLVVLSNGICPSVNNEDLAETFNLNLDEHGFFEKTQDPGIFVAGACKRPMRIDDCIGDADGVSQHVLHYLGLGQD